MTLILFPLIFVLCLYLLSIIFSKFLELDNYEKPLFSLGFIIIILNYLYLNLNFSMNYIFNIILAFVLIGAIFSIKEIKKISFKLLLIPIIISVPLSAIGIIYGEQFYIFRGNIYDHFVYLSTGLAFNSYQLSDLLEYNNNFPENLNHEFYLKHVLKLIMFRPSIQLFLGYLINFKFIEITLIPFIFKIIISILVGLTSCRFFKKVTNNDNSSKMLSIGFVFSFYYFYNFEIDAFSLIFSLPFLFLILSYLTEINDNLDKKNNIFFTKFSFLSATYFIIYPNGGSIFFVPICFYILYLVIKNKFNKITLKNIFILSFIFIILILPTFNSTILYLVKSQIPAGLNHSVDYWGYYGAFILGKDNPIHNSEVISQIKNIWSIDPSIISVLPSIIKINLDANSSFLINLIPSIFGYYHLSTSTVHGYLNYFLWFILIFLNVVIIRRLFNNFLSILKTNNEFLIYVKINLIFFVLFFLYLNFTNQIWSSIKLYFILSPIIYLIIALDFKKPIPKFNKKFLVILMTLLPIYKYSNFNYGIGTIDSFPSIIKKETKSLVNWNINKTKLKKCDNIDYHLKDNFHKIYISLIYKNLKLDFDKKNCKIELINENFNIKYY